MYRLLVAACLGCALLAVEGTSVTPCQSCASSDFSFSYGSTFDGTYDLEAASTIPTATIERVYSTYLYTDTTYGDIYGIVAFYDSASARRLEEAGEDFAGALTRSAKNAVLSYEERHPDLVKEVHEDSYVVVGESTDPTTKLETILARASAVPGNKRELADLPLANCATTSSTAIWLFLAYVSDSATFADYPSVAYSLSSGENVDIQTAVGSSWLWIFNSGTSDTATTSFATANCETGARPTPAPARTSGPPNPTPAAFTTTPTAAPTPFAGGGADCEVCAYIQQQQEYLQQQLALYGCEKGCTTTTATSTGTTGASIGGGGGGGIGGGGGSIGTTSSSSSSATGLISITSSTGSSVTSPSTSLPNIGS